MTELAADLPQVKAGRIQLQQVVMNLISNEIEAMKNTDRARELAIELLRSETGKVLPSIPDAGQGIPCTRGTGIRIHADRLWAANSPRILFHAAHGIRIALGDTRALMVWDGDAGAPWNHTNIGG